MNTQGLYNAADGGWCAEHSKAGRQIYRECLGEGCRGSGEARRGEGGGHVATEVKVLQQWCCKGNGLGRVACLA